MSRDRLTSCLLVRVCKRGIQLRYDLYTIAPAVPLSHLIISQQFNEFPWSCISRLHISLHVSFPPSAFRFTFTKVSVWCLLLFLYSVCTCSNDVCKNRKITSKLFL